MKRHTISQVCGSEIVDELETCSWALRCLRLLTNLSEHPKVESVQLRRKGVALSEAI